MAFYGSNRGPFVIVQGNAKQENGRNLQRQPLNLSLDVADEDSAQGENMERKEVKTTVCQALVASLLFSPVLVFAGSEAKNADQLINKLLEAAQTGDVESFLSGLTMESRKRVVAAYAYQASIRKIQETFQDALNQRFGQGAEVLTSPADDLKVAIGHLASAEVISQTPRSDGCLALEVKTLLNMENGQTLSRPDTLLVCQEEGAWKLLLGFAGDGENARERKAAAERIIREVRDGKYHDRISAMLAMGNAWIR